MPAGSALRLCTPRAVRAVPRDDHSRGGRSWFACPSCLACSLPRLVGLLGLFNSPYPSRTPKLSQWSDRPRRVGLGPQLLFLSRGSLTVRDSVVGRRWGFILVWLPVQQLVCPLGRHSAHRLQGRPLHATYPHHGRSISATAASCSVAPNGILPTTSNTLCCRPGVGRRRVGPLEVDEHGLRPGPIRTSSLWGSSTAHDFQGPCLDIVRMHLVAR